MKTFLDLDCWPRAEHFEFFSQFEEPFFGATVTIDCSRAYARSKALGISFFTYYLHKTLIAVNLVEAFRYRIEEDRVAVYDRIDVSATISREDGSFGFSFVEFSPDLDLFAAAVSRETARVKSVPGLLTRTFDMNNLIHFSAIPWLDFTALSHARQLKSADSCPKISFGKMTVDASGQRTFPMSVHVHHGLMDGVHLSAFVTILQQQMDL